MQVLPQRNEARIDSLNRLLRRSKMDTSRVELLDQLFYEHVNIDTGLARDIIEQMLRASKRSGHIRGMAAYWLNLAKLDLKGGKYRQARNYLQRSIDLSEDAGDPVDAGRIRPRCRESRLGGPRSGVKRRVPRVETVQL